MNNHILHRVVFISFLFFCLIILIPTFLIIRYEFMSLIKERLLANASAAALAYDGDLLEKIRPETQEDYAAEIKAIQKINTRLENIHNDIRFVYVMYKNDAKQIAFLVDSITVDRNGDGVISADEQSAKLGETYPNPPKEMLEAFIHPMADQGVNKDRWGSFLSGYAPIFNSKNEAVAIVGLDMLSGTVEEKMMPFYLTGVLTLLLSVFASILVIQYLKKMLRNTEL